MAETKFYIKVFDQATQSIKRIQGSFDGMVGSFRRTTSSLASFQGLMAFYTSGLLIRSIKDFGMSFVETASKFEIMDRKFKSLGAPNYTQNVIDFAKRNPLVGLENTQDAFVKLYSIGIDPTSKALQSLANAGAAFGLGAVDMERVLLAIGQMAGKRVVSMEELRQQIAERIPTAIKIMSSELGYAEKNLSKFYKDVEGGKISAREGLTALFEGLSKTYGTATTEMEGTWKHLMASMTIEWKLFQKDFMTPEMLEQFKKMMIDLLNVFMENKDFLKSTLEDAVWLLEKTANILKVILGEILAIIHALKSIGSQTKAGIGYGLGHIANFAGTTLQAVAGNQQGQLANWMRSAGAGMMTTSKNLNKNADKDFSSGLAEAYKMIDALYEVGKSSRKFVGINDSPLMPEQVIRDTKENDKPIFMGTGPEKTFDWKDVADEYENSYTRQMLEMAKIAHRQAAAYAKENPFGNTLASGFSESLRKMRQDFEATWRHMGRAGAEAAKIMSQAMENSFNDFFIDAMEGRLQQFKDYLLGFFKDIGSAISRILSQYMAMQALGVMMPGTFGGSAGGSAGASAVGRSKAGASAGGGSPSIQIVNNSGVPMEGTASYSTNDMGDTVMTVVMDAVGRNKGGSRDALRAMLAM